MGRCSRPSLVVIYLNEGESYRTFPKARRELFCSGEWSSHALILQVKERAEGREGRRLLGIRSIGDAKLQKRPRTQDQFLGCSRAIRHSERRALGPVPSQAQINECFVKCKRLLQALAVSSGLGSLRLVAKVLPGRCIP